MADVFISYTRKERSRVESIEQSLREAEPRLSVWFDARLQLGSEEGFDAEIEREVTSAAAVVVCWTPDALGSYYVKAEAKKGLDRHVLVPVFLEPCTLPVPFNALQTADLSSWDGAPDHPEWRRVVELVRKLKEDADGDREAAMARSAAAYSAVEQQIYPGALAALTRKIAALHDFDAILYHADIEAILSWCQAVFAKEANHHAAGFELADRQPGGSAWRFWDTGEAEERSARLDEIVSCLHAIEQDLQRSRRTLDLPTP
jgi:hypothetical protein